MLKKNLCLLCSLLTLLCAGSSFGAAKLVNGIDANFPPFAFIDKTGTPSGFDVEVMTWIGKDLGMEVTHQAIEWDGIITSLLTKKIDIIASGMSITEERSKQVNFTIPYWIIQQVLVTKKDSSLTVDQVLNGKKTIGVQQGTTEAKWFKQEAPKKGWNFELRYYSSSPLAIEDVLNGRIDAAAMDDAPAKDAASKKDVHIIGTFGMDDEEFGYAVRKDEKELLEKVNKSLSKFMATPEWNKLVEKYNLNK
ncbi:MAG: ABC transporter substrate-binding protein [Desulforhopalus sp.]|nr:ABC transporter substrate-binding protein [Desulforhopalus sp.]